MECSLDKIIGMYNPSQNKMFAITGDVDNLGIYVAHHGRATAEGLVDEYNEIIKESFVNFCDTNSIDAYISLSGEEIFIVGLISGSIDIPDLDRFMNQNVNYIIQTKARKFESYVTISFGVFEVSEFNEQLQLQLKKLKHCTAENYTIELDLLVLMLRTQLALCLDKEKFSTLGISEEKKLILYRNVVYAKMLQYKKETRKILVNLHKIIDEYPVLVERCGTKYGISDQQYQEIIKYVNMSI